MQELIADFLAQKRIAVAGLSRSSDHPANLNNRKLRGLGNEVLAVNPPPEEVEGDRCNPQLPAIPGGVDAGLVATSPESALEVVRECVALGISRVWMHRSFGQGSVSDEAAALGRGHGIAVIAGGCPMMFRDPVDVGHRCMRWFLRLTGGLPKAA